MQNKSQEVAPVQGSPESWNNFFLVSCFFRIQEGIIRLITLNPGKSMTQTLPKKDDIDGGVGEFKECALKEFATLDYL